MLCILAKHDRCPRSKATPYERWQVGCYVRIQLMLLAAEHDILLWLFLGVARPRPPNKDQSITSLASWPAAIVGPQCICVEDSPAIDTMYRQQGPMNSVMARNFVAARHRGRAATWLGDPPKNNPHSTVALALLAVSSSSF